MARSRTVAGIIGAGFGVLCFVVIAEIVILSQLKQGKNVFPSGTIPSAPVTQQIETTATPPPAADADREPHGAGDADGHETEERAAEHIPSAPVQPPLRSAGEPLPTASSATTAQQPEVRRIRVQTGGRPVPRAQPVIRYPQQAAPSAAANQGDGVAPLVPAGPTEWPIQVLWRNGRYTAIRTTLGDYVEYWPSRLQYPVRALLLIHGSIPSHETAMDRAVGYAQLTPWVRAAEQRGLVLIAPAFDRERYRNHRELEGRYVGADEFVLRIVDGYEQRFENFADRFYLYGHSAGGQFAHRFAVTYPDRVVRLVVTAAGNYAWPTDDIDWPYGRANSPNPAGFLSVSTLPVAVIVGSEDIYPNGMGGQHQKGENRIERGYYWIEDMRRLAVDAGYTPRLDFVRVPGVPHDTVGLTPAAVHYMFR